MTVIDPIRPWRYRGVHRMGWREELVARWTTWRAGLRPRLATWWASTKPRTPRRPS